MSAKPEPGTFLRALQKKYLVGAKGAVGCNELGPTGGLSKTDAKKQTTLDLLEHVVLQDAKVSIAGEPGAIRAACPSIEELDLTGNPLEWGPVLEIVAQLEKLRFLSLVRVKLPMAMPPPEQVAAAFGHLRTLVLNETGLSFESARGICAHLPQLEELQLGGHDIQLAVNPSVTWPAELASTFPALKTLLLEGAHVSEWGAVWALRDLPCLEVLSLNINPIESIEYTPAPTGEGGKQPFGQLKHLYMYESKLSDWTQVNEFGNFPSLREIRLQDAPVVHGIGASVARQLIIARVGGIDALNGASIVKREREAGERYYLRHLIETYPADLPEPIMVCTEEGADEVPTLPELPEAWAPFLAMNPRWQELVARHGLHSAQLPRSAEGSRTLAMQLVNLTLRSFAGESSDMPEVVRKLPTSLPVAKLKLVCCQVFKLDPLKQRLFYQPPGETTKTEPGFMEALDDAMRQLAFYGVADGGTIVMDEIAPTKTPLSV